MAVDRSICLTNNAPTHFQLAAHDGLFVCNINSNNQNKKNEIKAKMSDAWRKSGQLLFKVTPWAENSAEPLNMAVWMPGQCTVDL